MVVEKLRSNEIPDYDIYLSELKRFAQKENIVLDWQMDWTRASPEWTRLLSNK